ncbi:MAG TPA: hypothetical protein P5526_07580 [Anaerolineae bacterium]|nr:hypothetical protein [Anaerolineae bacterium]HRV92007.1 hypothetical protein [Anaerolineae bacterium]
MPFLVVALVLVLILAVGFGIIYLSTTLILKIFSLFVKSVFDQPINVTSAPITVKRSLREARHYAQLIRKTAQQHPAGPMQDRLALIIKPVDEWLANLDRLETALKKLYGQRNLTREIRQFSFEIEKLHRQLLSADEENLASLRSLLESKRKHQKALQQLQSFQNQAELRIQKIASDLGATHAEMLLVTAKGDFKDNRLQRLDENLQDQVTSLRDMISAMDEMGYGRAAN